MEWENLRICRPPSESGKSPAAYASEQLSVQIYSFSIRASIAIHIFRTS